MSDQPDDAQSDDAEVDVELEDLESDEALLDEEGSDEEVIDEFAERRELDDESWIEDGEKYRCPECQAVHGERADVCRVCGWQRT